MRLNLRENLRYKLRNPEVSYVQPEVGGLVQPRALREGHSRDLPELRLDPGSGGQRPGPGRQLCHPSRLLPIRSGIYTVLYTVKKISDFPVPSRDVIYQTLPGREFLNFSQPGRVW